MMRRWQELPLDGLVDLTANAGGEVFARCKDGTTAVFHRLRGGKATPLLRQPVFEDGPWYVDAVGRVWLQTREPPPRGATGELIVLQRGQEQRVIKSRVSEYGRRLRRPCGYCRR